MKEIKSNRYLRKEAIYSKMPIGDSMMPGQMSEGDIPPSIEPDVVQGSGETEIGNLKLFYTYDYDYNENYANDINMTKARNYRSDKESTNPNTLDRIKEIYETQIREDIEIAEEGNKLERSPDYGAPEYDPMDKYDF